MTDNEKTLDKELSAEEREDLKEKMCGRLKPRRLSDEETEQLKKEGRI